MFGLGLDIGKLGSGFGNLLIKFLDIFSSAAELSVSDYVFPDKSGNNLPIKIINNRCVHLNLTDNYHRIIGSAITGGQAISIKGWYKLTDISQAANRIFNTGGYSGAVKGLCIYFNATTLYVQSSNGTSNVLKNFGNLAAYISENTWFYFEFYWDGGATTPWIKINNGSQINASGSLVAWTGASALDIYLSTNAISKYDMAYFEVSIAGTLYAKYLCFETSTDYLLDVSGLGHNATSYGTKSTLKDGRWDGEPFAYIYGYSVLGTDVIPPDLSNPGFDVNGNALTYPASSGITNYLSNKYVFPDDATLKKLVFEFYNAGTPKELTFAEIDSATSQNILKIKIGNAITRFIVKYKNLFDWQNWGDSITQYDYAAQITSAINRTVTKYGYGGYTSDQILVQYLLHVDPNKNQILFMGSNNISETQQIADDNATAIAQLNHNRYIVMSPLCGNYSFGWIGGSAYHYFTDIEAILLATYGSRFFNSRREIIDNYNFNDVILEASFVQPAVGVNVQISVTDASFLATENAIDLAAYPAYSQKIRLGDMANNGQYNIISVDSATLITVQLAVEGAYLEGVTIPSGVSAFQEFDYFFKTKDVTASTFRRDAIHPSDAGIAFIAKILTQKIKELNI